MDGAVPGSDDDPGWRLRWSLLPVGLMPHVFFLRSNQRGNDGLIAIRSVFVSFCLALCLIGVVRVVLGGKIPSDPHVAVSLPITIAIGVLGLVLQRVVPARLDGSSDRALAITFRNRFFLCLAFSESGAIVAFVLSLVVGPWWIYFVGLAFTAVGFARIAPTRRRMIHDQDVLTMDGCHRSLVRAVRSA